LAIDIIERVPRPQGRGAHTSRSGPKRQIVETINYAYIEGIDKPEIRDGNGHRLNSSVRYPY
jgi:hypothetical protein